MLFVQPRKKPPGFKYTNPRESMVRLDDGHKSIQEIANDSSLTAQLYAKFFQNVHRSFGAKTVKLMHPYGVRLQPMQILLTDGEDGTNKLTKQGLNDQFTDVPLMLSAFGAVSSTTNTSNLQEKLDPDELVKFSKGKQGDGLKIEVRPNTPMTGRSIGAPNSVRTSAR